MKEGRAEIFIDAACEAELVRVLAYDLGRHSIDAQKQAACVEECRRIAKVLQKTVKSWGCRGVPIPPTRSSWKPRRRRADYLVTKDRDLLT